MDDPNLLGPVLATQSTIVLIETWEALISRFRTFDQLHETQSIHDHAEEPIIRICADAAIRASGCSWVSPAELWLAKVGFMLPIADERNSAASRLRDFDSGSTGTTQELPFALAAELVGTSQQWSSFTN